MSTSTRRSAALRLVGAALVGAVAAYLHVLRSDTGGGHSSLALTVAAWAVTALAAFLLYAGVLAAAEQQDADAPPAPREVRGRRTGLDEGRPAPRPAEPVTDPGRRPRTEPHGVPAATQQHEPWRSGRDPWEPEDADDVEHHETYTYRRGKRIGER